MAGRELSPRTPEARQRGLIYRDLVLTSLSFMIDQLGQNADLAKKIIEDAYSMTSSFNLFRDDKASDPPVYYFSFRPSPKSPEQETDEVVISMGVAPLRDPLVIVKTIREIDGKRYRTERSLLTDKRNRPIIAFWQASWEPESKFSIPQAIQVNFDGVGLSIVGVGTQTEQRVSREQAFVNFGPY